MLTLVLPVYNERENLAPLIDEIVTALGAVPHEILAVDDGSTDGSREELLRLRDGHPTLRILRLDANTGQSA
nr:glycosyltransferase [Gemmatimonadota bacterium]NIT66283.1 glycosyltransferase [Gemmatimonadota bacterium]NIU51484.1 glycosyltransferase [Gemmatimonadota bacterium]NIW35058.1 glycosyltransferase [Gemmatimonadota bacterium]NIW74715.1 glycosyltransferase [Gemmatimonadota bacterium]